MEKFTVEETQSDTRIDKLLSDITEHSRSTIQAMLKDGAVLVNGNIVKPNYKAKINDEITIDEIVEKEIELVAEELPLTIVYEDEYLLVVDKNDNMVVHPGAGNYTGTMVNALLYHVNDFKAIKGEVRPGIVHRIDKETSGLLVVAKTPKVLEHLSDQLKEKTVTRKYVALVNGVIPHNLGKVNAPIGRDPKNRQRMTTITGGKPAITNFKVISRFEEFTLVECVLETGRTHQIRVHMNYIGYPIYGDPKYGRRKTDTEHGQYLHAQTLGFIHPITEEYMEFESPLPEYFQSFINGLLEEE